MEKPFLANFYSLNCDLQITRGEKEITFFNGYAQEIITKDDSGYNSEEYEYKIKIKEQDLSNYIHKFCMLYLSGYESKDSEYQTEIVVGENVNQKIIFNKDFQTIRFLYPHADPDKDLAIYVNIIDQAYYNIKIYVENINTPLEEYTITRSQIYYISRSKISIYCDKDTLCNIIVEAIFIKNIETLNITNEPKIEISIRQIINTPSYLQKNYAKNHFTVGDNIYYLYTDIGKNDIVEVSINFLRDFGNIWERL